MITTTLASEYTIVPFHLETGKQESSEHNYISISVRTIPDNINITFAFVGDNATHTHIHYGTDVAMM